MSEEDPICDCDECECNAKLKNIHDIAEDSVDWQIHGDLPDDDMLDLLIDKMKEVVELSK